MTTLFDRITDRARGKSALYDLHPELLDRIPILRSYSGEEGLPQGQASFMSYYSTNAWIYKAIKVVSDAVCQLRLIVATDGTDGEVDYDPFHELSYILNNPNPTQGASDFWREWTILQLLAGDVGAEMVHPKGGGSKVLELWLRSPETIIIKPGPLGLRYRDVAEYKIDDGSGQPYNLTPDDFIFWRFANPLNAWRGISPLSAVRLGVTIDALAQAWTRLFFKNNARPDFALIAPSGITQSEKKAYEEALDQRTGADQPHRPIVLESGITDIKVLSFPPKDLEWLEQRKMSRDEVGAIYGVPDEIMGYGKDTYENFNAADRVLWTLTIVPLVSFRDSALTHKAKRLKLLKPNQRIATDLSEIDQLREDVTDKVKQLDMLARVGYPINILSPYLDLDLPPVDGGDIGYLSSTVVPISMAGTIQPAPIQAPPAQGLSAGAPKQKHFMLPYGASAHDAIWKYHQARLTPFVEEMQRILKREFQRQASEIDRKLRASKDFGRGRYKVATEPPSAPPFVPDKVPPVIQLFNPTEEEILFEEALKPMIVNAVAKLGTAAIEDVVNGRLFEVHNPHVTQGIDQVLNAVANKTNNTTWTQLVDLFQQAEAAGEGIPAIQERLSAYFGDRKSDWQTERIARTTMTGSSNLANTEAWDQSGVVSGKTWISALIPDRTREDHFAAHGQTVGLHESFSVGGETLEYPGDPIGSPGNIINCLCVVIGETE
jgi:HK97 family phage portal protein